MTNNENKIRERLVRLETQMEQVEKQLDHFTHKVFPTFVKLSRYLPIEKIVIGLAGTILVFVVKFVLENVFAK